MNKISYFLLSMACAAFPHPLLADGERTTDPLTVHEKTKETKSAAEADNKILGFTLSSNVSLASDYIWRGISQTNHGLQLSGGFKATHDAGLYASVWGSNVNFNDGGNAHLELDLNAGWSKTFDNNTGVDFGILHYGYPGAKSVLEYDFEEYYLGLSYTFEGVGLSTKYSWSPDFGGSITDKSAQYAEAGITYTFPQEVTATAHFGHSFGSFFDNNTGIPDSYDDWSLAISKPVLGFGIGIAYTGTDNDGNRRFGRLAEDRLAVSLSRNF